MSNWTKDQERAINECGSNIIVSAGAGSGKTAVLTERVIIKLVNGININNLLVLTFTNAAAAEMKNRIRTAIKKEGLKDQLNYIDSAYITTFDSFALSLVKKYHYLIDVSPNIAIMDSSIEVLKTNEIIDAVFENMYDNENFKKLIGDFCTKTDDIMKSIFKGISNKLDLVKNKEAYLKDYINNNYNNSVINKNIDSYIKLLMSKKEQINELYKDLKSRVDNKYIKTFNIEPLLESSTYEDIKFNLGFIGIPRKNNNCESDFKIYKDRINILLKELKELTRFKDLNVVKETIFKSRPYVEAIIDIKLRFDELFLEYKKKHDIYTFNDIALMSIKILKENNSVREEIKNNFEEIMIDEYQDTSNIQDEFINLISNNNVYMVGDIKQSIYRFRNANPYIFRDKYNKYSNSIGGIKIDLLKNFRSREEVLNNINLIFNLIMDDYIGDADYKASHQMNFGNMLYKENNKDVSNDMEILNYNPADFDEFSNEEIEAFTVAYDIKNKILNKYQILDSKIKQLRNCTYSDFSIIMDRGSSFDLYKRIFEYVGVPIVQIKNEKLTVGYDLIVIKNLIKLIIKINSNEYDDLFKYYFTSIARSCLFRLDDEYIFDIVNNNKYYESDIYIKCKNINIYLLSNLDLINEIINKFDVYEKLITLNNIKESIIKIDYLKDLALNLSNLGYTPLMFSDYLDNMIKENAIEYSLNTDNSDSVKILNIHKSKGLEYSICYFTGLYKKSNDEEKKSRFIVDSNNLIITPYIDNGVNNTIYKDLFINEEERLNISEKIRLFYVALTRVKEKIIMVVPLDLDGEGYSNLVPNNVRLNYIRISDMLQSIIPVLKPYIKNIDFNKIKLTKDYLKIKKYNYKDNIVISNNKIEKVRNDINYEEISSSRFSKESNKLINKEEYLNMKEGIKYHYLFEIENFKTTKNPIILKFLKHIDNSYINCYKEYEFIYEDNLSLKHGFIDLMLEYNDYINIIDYKLKNIIDDNYIKQLNGYKKYIKSISKKEVDIYLYSILEDKLILLNEK